MPAIRAADRFVAARSSGVATLRQGSRGAYVVRLQNLLRAKGYRIAADGGFGAKTAAAVRDFQRKRGLGADGVAGPKTWAALAARAAPAGTSGGTLERGARGAKVKQLQNLLRNKGFRISADGVFGAGTVSAVRRFQAARGLSADGVVGPRTWAALRTAGGGAVNVGPAGGGTLVTGYNRGRPTKIRIVPVGNGKRLNARAAGNYKAMMSAARRAGFNLSTLSGFRSMAQQQYLYKLYRSGRGNLAARPGYSNHQMGLSVDIGRVGGYNTKAFRWLKANAPRYGFVNDVRGEPWHWTYKR